MKFEEIIAYLRQHIAKSDLDYGNKERANAYLDKLVRNHNKQKGTTPTLGR